MSPNKTLHPTAYSFVRRSSSLRFRRRVSLAVGPQRLSFFICAVFGLPAAIFYAVFPIFWAGDVLLSAFLAGFGAAFWFRGGRSLVASGAAFGLRFAPLRPVLPNKALHPTARSLVVSPAFRLASNLVVIGGRLVSLVVLSLRAVWLRAIL